MKKTNLIFQIIPNVEDIELFNVKGNIKKDNDKNNRIREETIDCMELIEDSYFQDPIYGAKWTNLRNQTREFLNSLCDEPFKLYVVDLMAGRKHNYDFKVTYFDHSDKAICERNLEFKHGSSSIASLPQFLSLNIKFQMLDCPHSYDEYYYDNYIDQYISTDTQITEQKPSKEVYLKSISNVNYNVHPFFKQLYDCEELNKKQKFAIVNQSIKNYLNEYANTINVNKLIEKIQTSQTNKIFMMWDGVKFHKESMTSIQPISLQYGGIQRGNTILVHSNMYTYKLLLRWRNHKGILNPAWQISLAMRTICK